MSMAKHSKSVFLHSIDSVKPFCQKAFIASFTFIKALKIMAISALKTIFAFFKRSPRAFAALLTVVFLISCTATVAVATNATTAYSVMYDGNSLGAVSGAEVLAEAEILAANKLNNAECTNHLIATKLSKTIISADKLITAEQLSQQIISHSKDIVSAAVLSIDGALVAADSQSENALSAIDNYLVNYKQQNNVDTVELSSNVNVQEIYTLRSNIDTLPTVSDYLNDNSTVVPVQTVTTVVEKRQIAYETIKTESSKYTVGTEIVTQKGKNGVEEVTYKIAYKNGEMSEKTEISSSVISEAVPCKMIVGTKRVIASDKNGDAPMVWPVKRVEKSYVSSYVGDGRGHKGMDIAAPSGTPIYAAASGTVTFSGRDGSGYGNYIIIKHANGVETLYAHCKALYVKKGDTVKAGESIAAVGNTGRSTGNHLHFEVHKNGVFVNPSKYIGSN